jgi:hypothetical protein
MEYDLVCFKDGTKAPKSFVAFCVTQIKQMSGAQDGLVVLMYLIELSRDHKNTPLGRNQMRQLLNMGIIEKEGTSFVLNAVFKQVLIEADRQNTMYETIYNRLVYDKDPEKVTDDANTPDDNDADEKDSPFDEQPMQIFYIGMKPLFEKLVIQFEYYNSQTGQYSNIDYKPDEEFELPNTVRSYLQSLN